MNFYANIRNSKLAYTSKPKAERKPPAEMRCKKPEYAIEDDRLLCNRINTLMKKYKNNLEVKEKIKNEIQAFSLNVTVARSVKSKDMEKNLRRELNQFLSSL